jgi:hypothetical protein
MRLALLLALCASAGCAKAPFTTSVLDRYGLAASDLGRIQFFTSEKIVLEREVNRQTHEQSGVELQLHDDSETEVIEVSERTPCVVLRVAGDYLLLGFAPKDLRAALWFEAHRADGEEGGDARYVLAALDNTHDEDEQPWNPRFSKGFLISWSGSRYHVVSGRGAYLLYQLADDDRRRIESSPPGWRLSERSPQRLSVSEPPPSASEVVSVPDVSKDIEVEP